MYKFIAEGVYQQTKGKYRMRKTVNGKVISITFTNKAKAIKAYKSL